MKQKEIKLDDEGFEEAPVAEKSTNNEQIGAETVGLNRPDLRVVQADRDKNGSVVYTNVGGMWKNVSKNGNEFYTLKIGNLKLLVFPNNNK
ncbi:MAG: hypothetical protein ACP5N9_04625 [Candidatus Bilamarchaeum sp.]|jgi:hypothetical protein